MPEVTLLDLDDLKDFAGRSAERRRREISRVREILDAEISRYRLDQRAREVAPLVRALRERAEEIRAGEVERFRAGLADLTPEQRATVDALTDGIVNKLLHEPTVRLKDAATAGRGELLAEVLSNLFDVDTE
jgi:glutamyl-tRNA reductase